MDYNKTWEVMQGLEDAFNRVTTIETLVNDLETAVNSNNMDEIATISKAISAYLPTFIIQYDKASKRAWNNTVLEAAKEQVPYRPESISKEQQSLYKEVCEYYDAAYSNNDI